MDSKNWNKIKNNGWPAEPIVLEGELHSWHYDFGDSWPETIGIDERGKLDEFVLELLEPWPQVWEYSGSFDEKKFGKVRITIEKIE